MAIHVYRISAWNATVCLAAVEFINLGANVLLGLVKRSGKTILHKTSK